jgi:hypothetical protein
MSLRRALVVVSLIALAGSAAADEEKTLAHEWHEVGTNHWQITSLAGEDSDVTDAAEGNRGKCAPGMIEVTGKMRITEVGDDLQKAVCTKWINKEFPERCQTFDKDKWAVVRDKLSTKDMHFCIDRFEYPNKKGEYPVIFVDWNGADAMCTKDKKRLCTEDEWTFACEGDDMMPYPYGYERDKDACVVDKPYKLFEPSAYGSKKTLVPELDRLYQGVASGSQPKCKSPFGVYDMTGNVDEWTRSSLPGRKSILKGGWWGPVRTRCRPTTRAHGEDHAFYQQGLRCCNDVP